MLRNLRAWLARWLASVIGVPVKVCDSYHGSHAGGGDGRHGSAFTITSDEGLLHIIRDVFGPGVKYSAMNGGLPLGAIERHRQLIYCLQNLEKPRAACAEAEAELLDRFDQEIIPTMRAKKGGELVEYVEAYYRGEIGAVIG